MRLRSLRVIAASLALAIAATGCAKLPTNGEVKVGSDIQGGLTADYLYYSPAGPTEGDGQQSIINGFLNAATGPQNDYQIARQFLAGKLAAKWSPSTELLIADARPEVQMVGTVGARVSFNAVARVDASGRYTELGAGVKRILNYSFVREDGEWRINEAPDATILVRPVFDVLFKSYALYFYDKQERYLVPDLRWYATRVSTSTRLVSALLDGPTDWLSGAVHTAFPAQTKLAIDSVTVEDGVAIVDLAAGANKANVVQRQRMLAQLTSTLTQLANVFSVEIRIDHVPQKITTLPYEVSLANNPDPIVLTTGGLKALSNPMTAMADASDAAKRWAASDFALNNQQTLMALKGPQGVGLFHLIGPDSTITEIDARPGLLTPAIDPQGYVWSLGTSQDSTLQAFDAAGHQRFVSLGWLNGNKHVAFAISREGGRLAVMLNTANGIKLFVAAIERDSKGVPIAISNAIQIGKSENLIRSLSWVDETSVAVISKNAEGFTYAAYIDVGGEVKKLAPVSNAVAVTANNVYSSAYVLDATGQLRVLRSLNWIESLQEVLAIHFAG